MTRYHSQQQSICNSHYLLDVFFGRLVFAFASYVVVFVFDSFFVVYVICVYAFVFFVFVAFFELFVCTSEVAVRLQVQNQLK